MSLPTPLGKNLLIEVLYDPDKIGSIYMAPQAQNEAPSHGHVMAVGPLQTEIEVGFGVLVSTVEWRGKESWKDYYFYADREVIAFVTEDGEVFPRSDRVMVRPSWKRSGVVQHGVLFTPDRIFAAPTAPQSGTVVKVGEAVKGIKVGQVVVIPLFGGNELAVKDRVLYSIKEKDIPGILTHAVEDDTPQPARHRAKATRGLR